MDSLIQSAARRTISTNIWLNFHPRFLILFFSKAFFRQFFSNSLFFWKITLSEACRSEIRIHTNPGYLNPVFNYVAQVLTNGATRILATLSSKWKPLKSAVKDSVLGQRKFWQFHIVVWQSTVKKGTKRTCWAIVLPIKSFVLPRPCCCRQVPDIKMHVGTPLAFQFVSLVLRGSAKPYRWRYFVNCR